MAKKAGSKRAKAKAVLLRTPPFLNKGMQGVGYGRAVRSFIRRAGLSTQIESIADLGAAGLTGSWQGLLIDAGVQVAEGSLQVPFISSLAGFSAPPAAPMQAAQGI